MHSFEYFNAPDLLTAIALLKAPETELLAGGTDLLGELKRRIRSPRRLVTIKSIAGLNEIREEGGILEIGALASVSEIERHPLIVEKFPSLRQSASHVGTPQLRNMGTLGGNLCQHPRCWYFRSRLFPCWLKGGEKCFAVAGENAFHRIAGEGVCHSVHPSDLAPALIALDARVKTAGPKGEREIALEDLYMLPRKDQRQTTILKKGELVTGVRVPLPQSHCRAIFLKTTERKAWSFALVSLALHLKKTGSRIEEARMVLGGVAPIPWRAKEAENILHDQELREELIPRVMEASVAGVRPMRDNGYKVPLLKALVQKALKSI